MKSLVRQQFPDLTWGASDLDAAAAFWLRLYDAAAHHFGYSVAPHFALELRLSGFPQSEIDALATELERRAVSADLPNPRVGLSDRHTLSLTSDSLASPAAPPAGLGLPLVTGPRFEGLVLEIRLRTTGRMWPTRQRWSFGRVDVSLVIVGEIRGGRLLVKSVWRSYNRW